MADQDGVITSPDAGAPGTGGSNTPNTGNAPGGAQPVAEKTFSFKEDRSDWVPRTRLNEVSGKLTTYEKENLTLKQQLELAENRTRALVGVNPVDPKQQSQQEMRAAIEELVPEIKALQGFSAEQLQEVLEAAKQAQAAARQSSNRHAETMLNEIDAEATRSLGVEKLTSNQQKQLYRAYREAAIEAAGARPFIEGTRDRHDPTGQDFLSRHERGDKTLVKEFVKQYLAEWYEPARRSVTASQANRNLRPVPRGERARSLPAGAGGAKVDLNNKEDFKKAILAARGAGQE